MSFGAPPPSSTTSVIPPSVSRKASAIPTPSLAPPPPPPPSLPVGDLTKEQQEVQRRTALANLQDRVSRMAPRKIQVAIVMDATGSMAPTIEKTKQHLVQALKRVSEVTSLATSAALVLYRDVNDGAGRLEVTNFTATPEDIVAKLGHVKAYGGDDEAEDAIGGLEAACTRLSWNPNDIKVVLWTGDAPGHGYGCPGDNYSSGLPGQWTTSDVIANYQSKGITLAFLRLCDRTDSMIRQFEAIPEAPFFAMSIGSDFLKSLRTLLTTSCFRSRLTTGGAGTLSSRRRRDLVPATKIPISFTDFGAPVACKTWSWPEVDMSRKDKVAFFFEMLSPSYADKGRLVESARNWQVAEGYFAEGGCRYVRTALQYDESGGAPLPMVAKEFQEKELDSFDVHFLEVRSHYVCKMLAYIFTEKLGVPAKAFTFTQPFILEARDLPGVRSRYFTCENYVEGEFLKFNVNTGVVRNEYDIPNAFSHFTYEYSRGELMVLDAQGWCIREGDGYNYKLTDPALQTKDQTKLKLNTNLGSSSMDHFFKTHECSDLCRKLGLTAVSKDKTK